MTNTKNSNPLIIRIPFSGFYETMLSAHIEDEISRFIEDLNEEKDTSLCDLDFHINYSKIYDDVARKYVPFFNEFVCFETGLILNLEFDYLYSPRFYNYENDQIFVKTTRPALRALFDYMNKIDQSYFRDYVREKFTPCDGWIPFYSNELDYWGPVSNWDEAQLGQILQAFYDANDGGYYLDQAFIEDELLGCFCIDEYISERGAA